MSDPTGLAEVRRLAEAHNLTVRVGLRCGAILDCARIIHVGDDRHERADGVSWHWHETALPHRSAAPLEGLREAAQEVADHRHSVFAEGEWCGPMSRLRAALRDEGETT